MQSGRSVSRLEKNTTALNRKSRESYLILLASNDKEASQKLAMLLTDDGHTVWKTDNGAQLLETFDWQQPDIVIVDTDMPIIGANDATKLIKRLAGDSFIPVILMVPDADREAKVRYLEISGDDFINKSCIICNYQLVVAKIQALMRISKLYRKLEQQKDMLKNHQQMIFSEQQTARQLFEKFLHSPLLDSSGIRYLQSSMGIFNGDLLLAAHKPAGGLRVMVGDMTGHGLSAAVGSVPASEIFYSMTAKGYSISDILVEINQKLRRLLPTGNFCAASIIDFECGRQQVSVWNGGMPDVVLFDSCRQKIKEKIGSGALPLGVVDGDALNTSVVYVDIMPGDYIYLCSDGVTEARNPQGDMYGAQRLMDSIQRQGRKANAFDAIRRDFESFTDNEQISDDITLLEITCSRALIDHDDTADLQTHEKGKRPTAWSVELRLDADALRETDPRPLLTQLVMDLQDLQTHRDRLFTILAELFSNALEHGVLELDSALKNNHSGFIEYYEQRKQRLASLESGWIRISLEHIPVDCKGELHITVEDSGRGFDFQRHQAALSENTTHSGRGIALVRSLCQDLTFQGQGNSVRAIYAWGNCDPPH